MSIWEAPMANARSVWEDFLPPRLSVSQNTTTPVSVWEEWVAPLSGMNALGLVGWAGDRPNTISKGQPNSLDTATRPKPGAAPVKAPVPASSGSAYRVADITNQAVDATSRESFVRPLVPIARAYEASTGIPAAALLAVAAHESNWGQAGGNMLFGIKGSGLSAPTWEMVDGRRVNLTDSFQTYDTPADAFQAFVDLVSAGRYANAWANLQATKNWKQFFRDINRAGYATDPVWGDKINVFTEGQIVPLLAQIGG